MQTVVRNDLRTFAASMSRPAPRMGRPPGGPPSGVDWNDPEQVRAYKAGRQREYADRHGDAYRERQAASSKARHDARLAEVLASGKKPCPGPLCNGAVKALDQFYADPTKRLGVMSHCKDCCNAATRARYERNIERERNRARSAYQYERDRAIEIYGGQCEHCGFTDSPQSRLEFDHVNGDGGEHRKIESSVTMMNRLARTGKKLDDWELRLLCHDCHLQVTLGGRMSRERLRLLCAMGNNWPVL